MRKQLIEMVEDKTYEIQEKIVMWILTIYGSNVFHIHKNGCSIHLDRLSDDVIKHIYDYVVEQPN